MQQTTPKIEIRDGEVWVCLGYAPTIDETYGILRSGDLAKLKFDIAANERKRMAWLLDNINEFAAFVQFRGQPPGPGDFLEVNFPWSHEGKMKVKS